MAENSVIISAEEEAKLLKPIDEYVEKIQKKIDALRVDGSDKVNDLKNQIAIAKENKNLSKAQRDKIIENSKKELENAKKVEADNKEEIKKLAEIAKKVKPDYIKTSTGFGTGGATLEDVRLMKETVGDDVKVKAAGGVRDWETCKAMIEAGAERIGTSSSIAILEGFRNERGQQK